MVCWVGQGRGAPVVGHQHQRVHLHLADGLDQWVWLLGAAVEACCHQLGPGRHRADGWWNLQEPAAAAAGEVHCGEHLQTAGCAAGEAYPAAADVPCCLGHCCRSVEAGCFHVNDLHSGAGCSHGHNDGCCDGGGGCQGGGGWFVPSGLVQDLRAVKEHMSISQQMESHAGGE